MPIQANEVDSNEGSGGSNVTLPIAQSDVTGLTAALAGKLSAPLSAAEMILAVPTTTRSTNAFSGDLPVAPATLATGLIVSEKLIFPALIAT